MDCYCDFEPPIFYRRAMPVARKQHRCHECGHAIAPGEKYERVRALWERGQSPQTIHTCPRCLALRDYAKDNLPCFCEAHGNLIEDAMEAIREYAHELPGMLFHAYRLRVAISRGPKVKEAA